MSPLLLEITGLVLSNLKIPEPLSRYGTVYALVQAGQCNSKKYTMPVILYQ